VEEIGTFDWLGFQRAIPANRVPRRERQRPRALTFAGMVFSDWRLPVRLLGIIPMAEGARHARGGPELRSFARVSIWERYVARAQTEVSHNGIIYYKQTGGMRATFLPPVPTRREENILSLLRLNK